MSGRCTLMHHEATKCKLLHYLPPQWFVSLYFLKGLPLMPIEGGKTFICILVFGLFIRLRYKQCLYICLQLCKQYPITFSH